MSTGCSPCTHPTPSSKAPRCPSPWAPNPAYATDTTNYAPCSPPLRTYHRTGYLTDGSRTMMFEYPRDAPDGEQMDFVEVMEIVDGLIQRHCVYWGWRGVKVIQDDAYHK